MRRGIECTLLAGSLKYRSKCRRDTPLSVGTGNMDNQTSALLGCIRKIKQCSDTIKAGLYTEPVQWVKKIKSFLVGHRYLLTVMN